MRINCFEDRQGMIYFLSNQHTIYSAKGKPSRWVSLLINNIFPRYGNIYGLYKFQILLEFSCGEL